MLGRKRLVALLSLSLISASLTAQAEMYVGGQVGWSFPNDFTNVEGTKNLTGIGLSDLKLQNNLIYGAKLRVNKMVWSINRSLQRHSSSKTTNDDSNGTRCKRTSGC
jgi:hypothetical protein